MAHKDIIKRKLKTYDTMVQKSTKRQIETGTPICTICMKRDFDKTGTIKSIENYTLPRLRFEYKGEKSEAYRDIKGDREFVGATHSWECQRGHTIDIKVIPEPRTGERVCKKISKEALLAKLPELEGLLLLECAVCGLKSKLDPETVSTEYECEDCGTKMTIPEETLKSAIEKKEKRKFFIGARKPDTDKDEYEIEGKQRVRK